jgi:hypothetical protein
MDDGVFIEIEGLQSVSSEEAVLEKVCCLGLTTIVDFAPIHIASDERLNDLLDGLVIRDWVTIVH